MTLTGPTNHQLDGEHQFTGVEVAPVDPISTWQAEGILMEVLGCKPGEAAELIRMRSLIARRNTARA
jgi:hypothetical protein